MSESAPSLAVDGPTVCIDFKSPKAYLALRPTFALEDELGLPFDWLPLSVSPLSRPHIARTDEDRGTRHRRMRAEYNERDLRRYASAYGLELADLYRNPDVSAAGIGLLLTKQRRPDATRAYLKAVFDGHWTGHLDIAEPAAIRSVLLETGIDTSDWSAYLLGAGRHALDETSMRLRAAGLFDVPAYVVEGELFFGRQHLPMIRWLLTGKHGEPPI